jgi:hypothetical protein
MAQPRETIERASRAGSLDYRRIPLLELADQIASQGDRAALTELHENRPLFRYEGDSDLLMAAFLLRLKESRLARKWTGGNGMALEEAYDLTLDKFSNLPAGSAEKGTAHETGGPDCRYYYRAFYEYTVARLRQDERRQNGMNIDLNAAASLQHMVVRHFYLSCLESKRRAQRLVRRYFWQKDGYVLGLWMPATLPGSRCRQWLEMNVPDCDPKRVGERERVQSIVNARLTRPRMIPLDRVAGGASEVAAPEDPVSSLIEAEISVQGLARTVAEEKAENIDHQRPAIQALGKERLRQLVLGVFESVANGESCAKDLADAYGLRAPSFTRFAGRRWSRGEEGIAARQPPDLWKNAARLLAHHRAFVEAADKVGLLKEASSTSGPPYSSPLSR